VTSLARFFTAHPIEGALLAFYVALGVKSVVVRDWPRALYWGGALILMCGVLLGMAKR
jgi:hypothetical protein